MVQGDRTPIASRLPGWLALAGLALTVTGLIIGLVDVHAAAPDYHATWPMNDNAHEIAMDYSLLLLLFQVPVLLATAGQVVLGQVLPRADRRGYPRWSPRIVLAAASIITAVLNVAAGVYQSAILTDRQHRIAVEHLAFPTQGLEASMSISFLLAAFDIALVCAVLITGTVAGRPGSRPTDDRIPQWSAVFALPAVKRT